MTDARDGADSGGEGRNVVKHGQRDEVISAAGIVFPILAGADKDTVPGRHAELADLDVNGGVMLRHLT